MACLLTAASAVNAQHRHSEHFVAHEVAAGMTDGYQVVAADLNRDRRPDLLAVASGVSELAWFENPTWVRHVITDGLTRPENVAVFDTDEDGIPEIGLVSGFSQSPVTSTGAVTILTHRGDPTERWAAREIDRVPTSHRAHWADIDGSGRRVLVNAPMVGPQAVPPDFRDETPVVFYRPGAWQRELIATIEPWHGNQVVVYRLLSGNWTRNVIDTQVSVGHTAIAADLDGDGSEELIVADRGEARGVYLYTAADGEGTSWGKEVLDDDIQASGCTAADLNGDTNIDVVCIDRTEELMWYENTGR